MTPVVTLSLFGLVYAIKLKLAEKAVVVPEEDAIVDLDDPTEQND